MHMLKMAKKTWLAMALVLLLPVIGAAQDDASLEQLRQAATEGNAEAQLEIGNLYEFGFNMPKSEITALAWYLLAADQGNVLAIKRRDLLKSKMNAQDIEAAQTMAAGLVRKKTENTEAPQTAAPTKDASPASSTP